MLCGLLILSMKENPRAAYIVMLVSVKKKGFFSPVYSYLFFYSVIAERMYWGATSVVFALCQNMNNGGGCDGIYYYWMFWCT
ncbi:hypothetical protein GDO78_002116 [Eleutherodactylus coqui]|uniref:Uncharacterized protein n=1 Tax=Eleutherodactylus coqui TaxID=57060 RepID=A0A8J6FVD0_ELECQ|nr:hypothetical protein GDO78_002116 [Eleutherodactylus coqui]